MILTSHDNMSDAYRRLSLYGRPTEVYLHEQRGDGRADRRTECQGVTRQPFEDCSLRLWTIGELRNLTGKCLRLKAARLVRPEDERRLSGRCCLSFRRTGFSLRRDE